MFYENYKLIDLVLVVEHDIHVYKLLRVCLRYQLIYMLLFFHFVEPYPCRHGVYLGNECLRAKWEKSIPNTELIIITTTNNASNKNSYPCVHGIVGCWNFYCFIWTNMARASLARASFVSFRFHNSMRFIIFDIYLSQCFCEAKKKTAKPASNQVYQVLVDALCAFCTLYVDYNAEA